MKSPLEPGAGTENGEERPGPGLPCSEGGCREQVQRGMGGLDWILISAEAEMSFQLWCLKNASVFLLGFSVIHFCSHLAHYLFT